MVLNLTACNDGLGMILVVNRLIAARHAARTVAEGSHQQVCADIALLRPNHGNIEQGVAAGGEPMRIALP